MTIHITKHDAGQSGQTGSGQAASDLELRLHKIADQVVGGILKAVGVAGRVASSNQDRLNTTVDKAATAFDEKTNGKYAPKVSKFSAAVNSGVARAAKYSDRPVS